MLMRIGDVFKLQALAGLEPGTTTYAVKRLNRDCDLSNSGQLVVTPEGQLVNKCGAHKIYSSQYWRSPSWCC